MIREDCTIGCLQIFLSGRYVSKYLDMAALRASPCFGGSWMPLCHTLEQRAICWEDRPLIGQHAGQYRRGRTAIPEGTYRLSMEHSPTYKRMMPVVKQVPWFGHVLLRAGKGPMLDGRDILLGHLAPVLGGHPTDSPSLERSRQPFRLLCNLTAEAIEHGEEVWFTARSPWGWDISNLTNVNLDLC